MTTADLSEPQWAIALRESDNSAGRAKVAADHVVDEGDCHAGMGGWEWVILALIALLLFGGSRLAGIGKNAGKAIREFKEETAALRPATSPTPSRSRR